MPPSNTQRGSAVVEFIMLGTPALLLFGSGLTMFLNGYQDAVARAVVIDASRHAALADENATSARLYLQQKLATLLPAMKTQTSLQIDKQATVELQYQSLPSIFDLLGKSVSIKVVTPRETHG